LAVTASPFGSFDARECTFQEGTTTISFTCSNQQGELKGAVELPASE
jgi:hypothetical protein